MIGIIDHDPYVVAERIHDQRAMRIVAAVMKKCGVTQIDISDVVLVSSDEIAIEHHYGFFRIKGHFELETAPSTTPGREGEE